MSNDEQTNAIATALVNALMDTHTAGATYRQILDAAAMTYMSVVMTFRAEREAAFILPQMQEELYRKWQARMVDEGVGMPRH